MAADQQTAGQFIIPKIQYTMKQQEIDRLSIIGRANAETLGFFLKLRDIGLALAAVSAALMASPVALAAIVSTIAGYIGVAGAVASAVCQVMVKG